MNVNIKENLNNYKIKFVYTKFLINEIILLVCQTAKY